jgi:hypothetical protein
MPTSMVSNGDLFTVWILAQEGLFVLPKHKVLSRNFKPIGTLEQRLTTLGFVEDCPPIAAL